jgi:hypothetical protein
LIRADYKGDWKIGGFGFGVSTRNEPGAESEYEFPEYDSRLPKSVQRNLDFLGNYYVPLSRLIYSTRIRYGRKGRKCERYVLFSIY